MSVRRPILLALAMLWYAGWPIAAQSKTATLQKQGRWEAFGGTDDSGTQVCGVINTEEADRVFVIKRYAGSRDLTVQMLKNTWRISDRRVATNIRFDFYPPWEAEALPAPPDGLRLRIPEELAASFMREFGSSQVLRISFPAGDQTWELPLAGSPVISRTMLECSGKLDGAPATRR